MPDLRVFAFTIAATLLTAVLFGLAPALRATRVELEQALKENARSAAGGSSHFNLGRALIVGQVALSLVLLVGAGLFLGTLRNLLTVDTGFVRQNVLVINMNTQQATMPRAQRGQAYAEILDRLRRVPGVVSASTSTIVPLSGAGWNTVFLREGTAGTSPANAELYLNRVSSEYFRTLRIPLLAGRDFTESDTIHSPKVIILNESTARYLFGSTNALGKTIGLDAPGVKTEVIGIVKDSKYRRIDESGLWSAFLASGQDEDPSPLMNYEVRSMVPVDGLIVPLRAAIAQVNPDVSLEFHNFETKVGDTLLRPRVVALLSTAFGLLALMLAMVGLYGVTSYAVSRRKSEIGIRMALGQQRQSVTWLMLRDVLVLLVAGLALGLITSLSAGRLVASLLYGIKSNDPVQLALAVLVLAAAATLAAYLPARRAARLDPMAALRQE